MLTSLIKKQLKWTWAHACVSAGLHHKRLSHTNARYSVPILMYHRIVPGGKVSEICSSPHIVVHEETFRAQMQVLQTRYHPLSLAEFANLHTASAPPPQRAVIITFDDGWQDNYEYAFPILKECGIPATIFLSTGFMGTPHMFWPEKIRFLIKLSHRHAVLTSASSSPNLAPVPSHIRNMLPRDGSEPSIHATIEKLKFCDEKNRNALIHGLEGFLNHPVFPFQNNAFMTWEQVREMADAGIEFGSHTVHHKILTQLSQEEIERELTQSRELMLAHLPPGPFTFAYPNGDHDANVMEQVRQAGYTAAVTTRPGLNGPHTNMYALRRFNISDSMTRSPGGRNDNILFEAIVCGLL